VDYSGVAGRRITSASRILLSQPTERSPRFALFRSLLFLRKPVEKPIQRAHIFGPALFHELPHEFGEGFLPAGDKN
jgi:hypothetical protein